MKKLLLLIAVCVISQTANAQKFLWNVDMEAFLDNREYKSEYQISQSLMGIWVKPDVGIGFENYHSIRVGGAFLSDFGSTKVIDITKLTAFYEFDYKPFKLNVGLFPRSQVVNEFPAALMYDSINYFRPNMAGVYWNLDTRLANVKVWLDWTDRLTATTREAFLIGSSGVFRPTRWLYAGWAGYLRHSTGNNSSDPAIYRPLTEYAVVDLYAGFDLSAGTAFRELRLDGGYIKSFTNVRGSAHRYIPAQGVIVRFNIEWEGIGIYNTLYAGDDQMPLYDEYGSELYMGDPYYRTDFYNRSDIYIKFINTKRVQAKFNLAVHYAANQIGFQQQFQVSVNLNQNMKAEKGDGTSGYKWHKWFRRGNK